MNMKIKLFALIAASSISIFGSDSRSTGSQESVTIQSPTPRNFLDASEMSLIDTVAENLRNTALKLHEYRKILSLAGLKQTDRINSDRVQKALTIATVTYFCGRQR